MPRRVNISNLQGTTVDIINTIRANASAEYQSLVPEIQTEHDIPMVGEILFGYPTLANQFLTALVNRIAMVRVQSATFNNMYAPLKKGLLEFGETVEEVFVNICKAREFSAEKAEKRELKRSMPDVRSAFHTMNWRVQYPITIQDMDLRQAFLNIDGVTNLIAKIVDAVYTSAEYDEFLLFKYLIIKAICAGKMYPVGIDTSNIKNTAVTFRSTSNKITFMSNKYNSYGVTTTTPKRNQYIFMDSDFDAQFDVEVLASAFNMDKAEYIGRRFLIDDWTSFDNDRFSVIMDGSDQIELVTDAELAMMANVVGVLVDDEWFQVYDNLNQMTEKYVASGMYWNYFYNVWKTVSSSPFSNAVVFVIGASILPASFTTKITGKTNDDYVTTLTLDGGMINAFIGADGQYIQTEEATENGVAVHKYGAYIIPKTYEGNIAVKMEVKGQGYTGTNISADSNVGDTITMIKDE